MDLRPRKKSKTAADSDDENGGSVETDREWMPEQNESNEAENENETSPDTEFDSTEGFRLKNVKCTKQSKHLIWNMFGHLMKNDKFVDRVKDRIYCIKCFEKKKFKG